MIDCCSRSKLGKRSKKAFTIEGSRMVSAILHVERLLRFPEKPIVTVIEDSTKENRHVA